jgi:hypothetical protein
MERQPAHGRATDYWIVFTQGKTHWITRWLKANFSHIYLFTRDQYNWIALNPTRLYLQVHIPALRSSDPYPATVYTPADTVLKVTFRERDDTQQYGSIGFLNCVTWAKYILGLRVRCITPYGLYKSLVRFSTDRAQMEAHGITSIERVQG